VRAVPLICSSLVALAIAPGACRALAASPLAQTNYRGARLATPLGLVIVVAALAGIAVAATLGRPLPSWLWWSSTFVCGVALLGLADDALGRGVHGWRAHAALVRARRLDTGAIKALGTPVLALAALLAAGASTTRLLLGGAVLVLSTHLFNLVDLRPGRAVKLLVLFLVAFVAAGGRVAVVWTLGLFLGPALVAGWLDLRERGMLGDSGAALLGALAGVVLVETVSPLGLAIALCALAASALYGEFYSISEFVDRAPLLRHLDWVGRPHDALDY
jgi:UDP-GlcNAc:undecaprenyl-phosphate GlcNAc-1-phosphate transferase